MVRFFFSLWAVPATAAICLVFAGCGDDGGAPAAESAPERAQWAQTIAENVVVPTYEQFATDASALQGTVDAWAQNPTSESLLLAQNDWQTAMNTWQSAELMQFGPAGAMSLVAGGEDLRDLIYSWPLTNPCRIDQELEREGYAADFDNMLVAGRGLDALEYLLFVEGTDNACAQTASINRDGTWAALDNATITARRTAYAQAAATAVMSDATDLVRWWSSDGQAFIDELSTAGQGSDTYGSASEAFNALTDAFFYLEKETKDMKLAIPLGIINCDETACPDAVEHPYAGRSLDSIRENVLAMQLLYQGGPTTAAEGFDDWLTAAGASDLAATMHTQLSATLTALDAVDGPLHIAIVDDRDDALAAHEALRTFITTLKTQFITTLDLEIPNRAEGDND
ncbi:MAG: putative lipoprotein [Bradymonadia bacterium]|jgi:predicted lipoprotein